MIFKKPPQGGFCFLNIAGYTGRKLPGHFNSVISLNHKENIKEPFYSLYSFDDLNLGWFAVSINP